MRSEKLEVRSEDAIRIICIIRRQLTLSREAAKFYKLASASLLHSYTYTLIHPYTYTLIHPYTYTPIHPYTHPPIHNIICGWNYLWMELFDYLCR